MIEFNSELTLPQTRYGEQPSAERVGDFGSSSPPAPFLAPAPALTLTLADGLEPHYLPGFTSVASQRLQRHCLLPFPLKPARGLSPISTTCLTNIDIASPPPPAFSTVHHTYSRRCFVQTFPAAPSRTRDYGNLGPGNPTVSCSEGRPTSRPPSWGPYSLHSLHLPLRPVPSFPRNVILPPTSTRMRTRTRTHLCTLFRYGGLLLQAPSAWYPQLAASNYLFKLPRHGILNALRVTTSSNALALVSSTRSPNLRWINIHNPFNFPINRCRHAAVLQQHTLHFDGQREPQVTPPFSPPPFPSRRR